VADEHHVCELQLLQDLEQVVGVPVQRVVFREVVRLEVRPARAHVVEDDHAVVGEERGGDFAPHILVAAESVREDDRRAERIAGDGHVVAPRHGTLVDSGQPRFS
jgi:hypothetical protein